MTMNNRFSNEYCQFITSSIYSGLGGSLNEEDLPIIQQAIAEWCAKNALMADAIFDEGVIVLRVGHFSEDAGLGMQMSIFQDIGQKVSRIVNKGIIFDIKETIKNPFLNDHE